MRIRSIISSVVSFPWKISARMHACAPYFTHVSAAFLTMVALGAWYSVEAKTEQAVMCLGENFYHEVRGETKENTILQGKLTLARIADPDRQWPKSICGAIGQDRQFSWVLDYRLATKRSEKQKWEESQALARALLTEVKEVGLVMPKGWECARYYKRVDNRGVSKASLEFFKKKLEPVPNAPVFGSHVAYQEKGACKHPLPTV